MLLNSFSPRLAHALELVEVRVTALGVFTIRVLVLRDMVIARRLLEVAVGLKVLVKHGPPRGSCRRSGGVPVRVAAGVVRRETAERARATLRMQVARGRVTGGDVVDVSAVAVGS
jgi:hypothetical protein